MKANSTMHGPATAPLFRPGSCRCAEPPHSVIVPALHTRARAIELTRPLGYTGHRTTRRRTGASGPARGDVRDPAPLRKTDKFQRLADVFDFRPRREHQFRALRPPSRAG